MKEYIDLATVAYRDGVKELCYAPSDLVFEGNDVMTAKGCGVVMDVAYIEADSKLLTMIMSTIKPEKIEYILRPVGGKK